ncbi:NAD(+) synthase [Thermotoga profunda]|uniref:NAD(+) synthase n=1 Tax=Thermotoga profunda TaxID=1508420 RepID=UPI000596BB35|nr:NAD(+) synthase [Thermotoga profunda]
MNHLEKICDFISSFVNKYNYKGVVIGISGGIDSTVVAYLCVKAIGKDRVFGLILPERDSSKDSIKDGVLVCKSLEIPYKIKSITPILRKIGIYKLFPPALIFPRSIQEKYVLGKWQKLSKDSFIDDLLNQGNEEFLKGLAYYRIKHRVRMCNLYFEAEKRNYAVAGTTNKTEILTGLYVKWGDDASDFEPIAHLYKTEIYELAKELKVPEKIIKKKPSPDLIPGLTDEFVFEMSYEKLDRILKKIENNSKLDDEDPQKVQRVLKIIKAAEKRKIKTIKITDES